MQKVEDAIAQDNPFAGGSLAVELGGKVGTGEERGSHLREIG